MAWHGMAWHGMAWHGNLRNTMQHLKDKRTPSALNRSGMAGNYEGWIGTKISMGNVTCFRAMSYVIGLCLMSSGRMFSGNVFCVDRAHVFGQCFLCT